MKKYLIKIYYKKGIYKDKDLNTFVNARFYHGRRKERNYGGGLIWKMSKKKCGNV